MLDFLYNPQGRISRKGYVLGYFLPYLLLVQILGPVFGGTPLGLIFSLISLFYIWPSLVAVPVKRFHDMGVTGWYQAGVIALNFLAALIMVQGVMEVSGQELETTTEPAALQQLIFSAIAESSRGQLGLALWFIVSIGTFLLFSLVKGQAGANRFGDDPLAGGRGFAD